MEDHRICNKFCVKNGFQRAENFWMLQTAYGDAVKSRRRVFKWYKRFKEGREETADNERSGRPSTSTTREKVDKVLKLDIFGVRRLNAVLVPKDLTFDQKNARKKTASLNLEATTDDPELLKRVITGEETWIYGFDSETTQQASAWRFKNEPRPKKARKAPSKVKVMLTVFFDYQGIVHHDFQQQGSTMTADSYLGVLRRLREAIRQKRPELWRSKSWILHHDNAPVHTALKISKFLQDHSTSVFFQPPYSPDLAPCDFFLFGKLKKKPRYLFTMLGPAAKVSVHHVRTGSQGICSPSKVSILHPRYLFTMLGPAAKVSILHPRYLFTMLGPAAKVSVHHVRTGSQGPAAKVSVHHVRTGSQGPAAKVSVLNVKSSDNVSVLYVEIGSQAKVSVLHVKSSANVAVIHVGTGSQGSCYPSNVAVIHRSLYQHEIARPLLQLCPTMLSDISMSSKYN
ncbi:hypothetical protein LAZ67_8000810 [Cordylochernes scorpioides]|uniref:Mos1 transposase HTH domain-containing protein n=1 Tax=Cordylochernes scorpioides TaxID=51811 RepID=A0ABY6KPP8_9ARAC|nr:hypothetical protein LAZ67_8000810 [Cordylochernes scorpioides]